MDKRDNSIYLRIPDDLKRKVKRHAAKHYRNFNQDVLWLLQLALHVDQFMPEDLSDAEAGHDET